jgi:hypothetical protein
MKKSQEDYANNQNKIYTFGSRYEGESLKFGRLFVHSDSLLFF